MSAVPVDIDSLHLPAVNIAADVLTLFNDQALFSGCGGKVGKPRAVKSGAYQQIIILFHGLSSCCVWWVL